MAKKTDFTIIKDLKRIEKINGSVRSVSIGIEDNYRKCGNRLVSAAKYGSALDENNVPGQKRNYHFSDAGGKLLENIWELPDIKKSVDSIVSGKRRDSAELDHITELMAKEAVDDIKKFIMNGAHRVYQPWKGTNTENLVETETLYNSIVGVAKRKDGTVFWSGV